MTEHETPPPGLEHSDDPMTTGEKLACAAVFVVILLFIAAVIVFGPYPQ